jgi:hypothetical protein
VKPALPAAKATSGQPYLVGALQAAMSAKKLPPVKTCSTIISIERDLLWTRRSQ